MPLTPNDILSKTDYFDMLCWFYDDDKGVYTFQPNPHLQVKAERAFNFKFIPYKCAWTERFECQDASQSKFSIIFNKRRLATCSFVSVDGSRAYIPEPQCSTKLVITQYQYSLARMINEPLKNNLDHYLNLAEISVIP